MRTLLLLSFAGSLAASPLTFSMSGTFDSNQSNNSPYFAPNATWALSFVVDSNPTVVSSFSNSSYSDFEADYSDASYTLNGSNVPLTGLEATFYSGLSVFLEVCLDSTCANEIGFAGSSIFTGAVTDPTILAGAYPSTSTITDIFSVHQDQPTEEINPGDTVNVSGDPSPVPEPSTTLAIAGSFLALVMVRRRRISLAA